MIKFQARLKNGDQLVGLGLSHENLARLSADEPILVDVNALGIVSIDPIKVLVFVGKTEEDMKQMLAKFIGPDTVQHGDTDD